MQFKKHMFMRKKQAVTLQNCIYPTFPQKIYSLQTDLTQANDKAEEERQLIQDKKRKQLDLKGEKENLIKELNMRISQLDKENKEAAIESERKLRADKEDTKKLQKILNNKRNRSE